MAQSESVFIWLFLNHWGYPRYLHICVESDSAFCPITPGKVYRDYSLGAYWVCMGHSHLTFSMHGSFTKAWPWNVDETLPKACRNLLNGTLHQTPFRSLQKRYWQRYHVMTWICPNLPALLFSYIFASRSAHVKNTFLPMFEDFYGSTAGPAGRRNRDLMKKSKAWWWMRRTLEVLSKRSHITPWYHTGYSSWFTSVNHTLFSATGRGTDLQSFSKRRNSTKQPYERQDTKIVPGLGLLLLECSW